MITYSIIQKSKLEGAHRLDAEYCQPEYLEYAKRLQEYPRIGDLIEKILRPRKIKSEYSKERLLFLLAENVRQNFIFCSEQQRMPDLVKKEIKQNLSKNGDVVVARSGVNFGDVAFFEEIQEEVFASADVLLFVLEILVDITLLFFLILTVDVLF